MLDKNIIKLDSIRVLVIDEASSFCFLVLNGTFSIFVKKLQEGINIYLQIVLVVLTCTQIYRLQSLSNHPTLIFIAGFEDNLCDLLLCFI